jgi:hypothetical protein
MSKTIRDLTKLEQVQARQDIRASRKQTIDAEITPELAHNLGRAYILGVYTNPELTASAAVAGISSIEDLHINAANQMVKQGNIPGRSNTKTDRDASAYSDFLNARPGDTVTIKDPKTGKPITVTVQQPKPSAAFVQPGQQPMGLIPRTEEEKKAGEQRRKELEQRVPVVDMASASARYGLRGMQGPGGFKDVSATDIVAVPFNVIGLPFHFTGAAISMLAPDELKGVGKAVRGFTKTVTAPALALGEIPYNFAQFTLRDAYAAGQMDGNAWDRFQMALNPKKIVNNLAWSLMNTTVVQAGMDIASGDLDTGGGFFVQGETGRRVQERQAEQVGTVAEAKGVDPRLIYGNEQEQYLNKTFNPGFLAGESLVDARIVSRDSEVYDFVSDLVDTGIRIGLDAGFYGLDPTDILVGSVAKRFNVGKQVALDYVEAKKAGRLEDAMRIAVENNIDTEVADLLTNVERQNSVARSIFDRVEGTVYSGDRSFDTGKTVESFLDITDPDYVRNPRNLFGEGLYVTDQAVVASTQGYNVDGVVNWDEIDPQVPASLQEILPEGAFYGSTGLNKGGAGVWKFDRSELNLIDSEQIVGPGDELFDLLNQISQDKIKQSAGVAGTLPIDEITNLSVELFTFVDQATLKTPAYSPEQFYASLKNFDGTLDDIFIQDLYQRSFETQQKVVDEFPQISEWLKSQYGFDDGLVRAVTPKIVEVILNFLSRLSYPPTLNPNRSVANLFESLRADTEIYDFATRPGPSWFRRSILSVIDEDAKFRFLSSEQSNNLYKLYNDIDLANDFGEIKGKSMSVLAEMWANIFARFSNDPRITNLLNMDPNDAAGRRSVAIRLYESELFGTKNDIDPLFTQKALVAAGYDGLSYDGGKRMGGAGEHTASVIWVPSKLKFIDLYTGEQFPINRAVAALDNADNYRIRAEELQTYRETIDGWKQAAGAMDGAPRTVEPTRINYMRYSDNGRRVLQAMADEKSPVVIWRDFLKKKSPNAAIRIAQATTPDEVWKIIEDAVYSGDPNANIRQLPNGWGDWASDTGYKVKTFVDRYSKQTAMMPDSTYIPFDDSAMALQRTERILQVTGVRGDDADIVMNALFKAIEEQTPKAWDTFFEIAAEKQVAKRMLKAGWTPDEIRKMTSYRRKGDQVTRWTLEDLADGIPMEWFDEGDGPLRVTQLLSGGGYLVDPEVLDSLIRDLNPFIRGIRKLTQNNPEVAKTIDFQRSVERKIEYAMSAWAKPAALGAPLPFRYIMRVVPEEMLRIAFSGEFDNLGQYVAAIFSGHLNYDTFGNIIMDSQKAADKMAKLQALRDQYDDLSLSLNAKNMAAKSNDPAEVARFEAEAAKIQKRIDKFENKYGTIEMIQFEIDELAKVINDSIPSAQRQLSTNVKGHLEANFEENVLQDYMERSKVQEVVRRTIPEDGVELTRKQRKMNRNWVEAQARDIGEMTLNKDYNAVAGALLDGSERALDDVAQSLLDGDLRPVYEEYMGVWGVKSEWDWNTIEAARARVKAIAEDIRQRTAMHPDVLKVISDGNLDGQKVIVTKADRVYDVTPDFKPFIKERLLSDPNSPELVPHYPIVRREGKAARGANFMYNSFGLYTKSSAAMARNPLWVRAYWRRVQELMPAMDRVEAGQIITVNADNLPDYILDTLKEVEPRANGNLTRDEVSRIAEVYARETTDKLLYNAQNNKSYFGYRHQIMFMFFDAYREQWSTWIKLMKQPRNLHKVDVLTRELGKFREPFASGDDPILHDDPTTQRKVITVPFSRWLYKLTGGDAQLSIPTRNLSLVGSIAPGFSPVVTLAASSWKPSSRVWANVKSSLFPFAAEDDVSLDPRDYFVPQFAQYFATGVAGVGQNKVPQLNLLWNFLEAGSGPNVERIKQASVIPIMRQLASNTDKYPLTPDGRRQLLEDADELSSNFAVARSFARTFLPAAPIVQFFADTKQGNVLQGVLLDDIRKTENEVFARGGTLTEAINILLDRYGLGIWAYFGSGSETNIPGLQPTKEYQNWLFENENILEKYPNAGGYLGPQQGEYNAKVFRQQTLLAQRQLKGGDVSLEDAANLLAASYYENRMATVPFEWQGTDAEKAFRNEVLNEVEARFPTWDPLGAYADSQVKRRLQFQDIEKMVADPSVTKTPQGAALKDYMDARRQAVQAQIDFSNGDVTDRNWNTLESTIELREYLFRKGRQLIDAVPEFAPMWQNVLVKEFKTDDLIKTEVTDGRP